MTGVPEWITPLNALLGIVAAVGGGGATLIAWALRQRRAISAEISGAISGQARAVSELDDQVRKLDDRTDHVERVVERVEARVEGLPSAGELHELHTAVQTLIAEIKGDRQLMQRIEKTLDRHEQTLERLWNVK